MLSNRFFQNPGDIRPVLDKINRLAQQSGPVRLMEICGTHTMAIAKSGLKSLLPESVQLISGPGCPVCVTPDGVIDAILKLTEDPRILIACYGDLLRVPGTKRGDCLLRRKALGARVESVYSPLEALTLAEKNTGLEIVFLGVGFETTAPGTAACILEAASRGLRNFSVLCQLKRTEPALRSLIASPDFAVDAFLCPGHVAAVTGFQAFSFLPEEFGLPAVVSGFDAADLVYSVLQLVEMLASHSPKLINEYKRVVRPGGNPAAARMTEQVFTPSDSIWRGLGTVPMGGLSIRESYAAWDAQKKLFLSINTETAASGCQCASVIRGVLSPDRCPLFGTVCTPADPVGPCMVSPEGACAAAYKYRD